MIRWEFELGQRVKLVESGEEGLVIGRAEYINMPNQYLVRYRAGNGQQVEAWWAFDAISPQA